MYTEVSENRATPLVIIHFNGMFHPKPVQRPALRCPNSALADAELVRNGSRGQPGCTGRHGGGVLSGDFYGGDEWLMMVNQITI